MASTNEFAGTLAGFDALKDLMGEDGIQELMGFFIEDGGVHIAKLASALERRDAAVLASEAHALKGSSATVGAQRMAALCGQLESRGRAGTTLGADRDLATLAEEFDRVTVFLAKPQRN